MLETFWQQLTRSAINKFLFWALSALTLLAGAYTLTGLDEPVDRLSARYTFLGALFIWGVNVLVTWLSNENQEKRDDLTRYDSSLIIFAILAVVGAALGISAWLYIGGVLVVIWVIVFSQPDTHYTTIEPMDATPRQWAAGVAFLISLIFLLGILGGFLIG